MPNRGEEETHTVADIQQGGHKSDIIFVVKRDSTVLNFYHPDDGVPEADAVGRSVMVFFSQEHSAEIISSFENVFASKGPQSFVCRGKSPLADGAWYHCHVTPDHGDSGVESATVFAREITGWKREEDKLRAEIETLRSQIGGLSAENEKLTGLLANQEQHEGELSRFREILDYAGEAVFITDPHSGRFVDVNETACRWLGLSRETLQRMSVRDLNLEFPLESGDGIFEHVTNTRDVNRPKAFVRGSHRRRDGTSFPVEVTLSQRRLGDRDFLLVVARDVNQRHRPDQAYHDGENERRGLFAISRDAGYCSARDGTVSEVNDSALDLFGYTRAEFLGLEARRLYCRPEQIRAFQRAVEEGGSVKNFRAEFQTKTGESFQGLLGATMRYDSNGNVQGYQCFVAPVVEIAALENEADRAVEEARSEAQKARADVEQAKAEVAAAKADVEQARTEAAKARLDAEAANDRADELEKASEQAQREVEDARSETATAMADVDQAMALATQAERFAEEAKQRADALVKEAKEAKSEIEKARSEAAAVRVDLERAETEAATAKADVEQAKTLAAQAKLDADWAKSQADSLEKDAAQAGLDVEHAMTEATKAKLDAKEAINRAERAEAEAEQARLETAKAKEDVEQANSRAAAAQLDAEEAKEQVQQLKREAESTMSETQKAVNEAASAWAELERAERDAGATRSTTSGPIIKRIGTDIRVHVKQPAATDMDSIEAGAPPVLWAPALRHRRGGKQPVRPRATHWSKILKKIVRPRRSSQWWRRDLEK